MFFCGRVADPTIQDPLTLTGAAVQGAPARVKTRLGDGRWRACRLHWWRCRPAITVARSQEFAPLRTCARAEMPSRGRLRGLGTALLPLGLSNAGPRYRSRPRGFSISRASRSRARRPARAEPRRTRSAARRSRRRCGWAGGEPQGRLRVLSRDATIALETADFPRPSDGCPDRITCAVPSGACEASSP
jgi:hypothetical protein